MIIWSMLKNLLDVLDGTAKKQPVAPASIVVDQPQEVQTMQNDDKINQVYESINKKSVASASLYDRKNLTPEQQQALLDQMHAYMNSLPQRQTERRGTSKDRRIADRRVG